MEHRLKIDYLIDVIRAIFIKFPLTSSWLLCLWVVLVFLPEAWVQGVITLLISSGLLLLSFLWHHVRCACVVLVFYLKPEFKVLSGTALDIPARFLLNGIVQLLTFASLLSLQGFMLVTLGRFIPYLLWVYWNDPVVGSTVANFFHHPWFETPSIGHVRFQHWGLGQVLPGSRLFWTVLSMRVTDHKLGKSHLKGWM